MEFNFETPLILNLRKMAGKPLTLVLSVFSFLLAVGFGIYLVKSLNIIYGIIASICITMCITYLAVFCSVKKSDRALGGGAFSFGAVISVLGIAAILGCEFLLNHEFSVIVIRFIKNLSGSVLLPEFDYYSEAGATVGIIFFISAFFAFTSAKNTASKNFPHKAAGVIFAIVCFVLATGVLVGAAVLIVIGGYEYFILDSSHIYYSVLTLLILINLILGGVFATNLVKASGVK